MKLLNFFKNRKTLIGFLALVFCVVLFGTALFLFKVKGSADIPKKSETIGGITAFDDEIALKNGDLFIQEYEVTDFTYEKIGLLFTLNNVNDADGFINLDLECGEKLFSKTIKTSEVILDKYTYVSLPTEIMSEGENKITLRITDFTKEGFVIAANKSVLVENAAATLNGQALNTNAVVDLRTEKVSASVLLYLVIFGVMVLFLAVFAFLVKGGKISFAAKTALAALVLCLLYIFVFTPSSVPDEPLHYTTAYHISNQMMFKNHDTLGGIEMRAEDALFVKNSSIALGSEEYAFTAQNNYLLCKNKEMVTTENTFIEGKNIVYAANGFGITIARLIGLSAYWTFQMGRIFNILLFVLALYFSVKIMPFGKVAVSAIALLPINLHIMASNSYDVFTFSAVMLLFCYIIKLSCDKTKIGIKELLLLGVLICLAVPHKVVYISVAAILLVIPKAQFKTPKLHFWLKVLMGAIAVISILVLQFANTSKLTSDSVTNSLSEGYSISYVLTHLKETALLIFNSVINLGDFYLKSMVAYFGWFQLEIPWFICLPYLILLLVSFMRQESEPKPLKFYERIYSVILFAVSFLLIELLLLIDHTPKGSGMVLGVQGRYFIPALPLIFLAVRNGSITLKKNSESVLLFLSVFLNAVILLTSLSYIYCI